MMELSYDMSISRPVEAREYVRRLYELFFKATLDKSTIESNVKKSFQYDRSVSIQLLQDLKAKGYYNRIISGKIQQRVEVDSVVADFNNYFY